MAFKVLDKFYNSVVEYKHRIDPIEIGGKFYPNYDKFNGIHFNMLPSDFKKYQERGETIIVNFNGGWCTLTDDMEIIEKKTAA
jgi:hypothetical protein